MQSGGNRCYKVTECSAFFRHATYKAFYKKKIPPIEITASPMIARHAKDFTWNRGCSSNPPPLKHADQIPHPLEDSDNQIPSSPGRQRCQMPGVCPGGGKILKFRFDRYIKCKTYQWPVSKMSRQVANFLFFIYSKNQNNRSIFLAEFS